MSRSAVPRDPAITSRTMAAVKSKDSRAELALRRALHARGVRYRLHAPDVMGRPDLVLRRYKIAIFVDGDMWHGNAWRLRGKSDLASLFPTRTEWWTSKIQANMARDETVNVALTESGWHVLRIWESSILHSTEAAAELIATQITSLKAAPSAYHPSGVILIDLPTARPDSHQRSDAHRLAPPTHRHVTPTPLTQRMSRPHRGPSPSSA